MKILEKFKQLFCRYHKGIGTDDYSDFVDVQHDREDCYHICEKCGKEVEVF